MRILITGGAGFIGTNLATRLLSDGLEVRILDSLSREGTASNLRWLERTHATGLDARIGDVRDREFVVQCMRGIDHVVHLAAQVAVTSSLQDPRYDFEVNSLGTLNVLEAIRLSERRPSITFCSTNKVYGALADLELSSSERRYQPENRSSLYRGVDETRPLDFHSPYGCSKGAADQYVLDYARSFNLQAMVLRMSCIYGPHQHGNEDQGWVAHFVRCALEEAPITIYGDGKQVRDVLFVEDLVDALEISRKQMAALSGRAFNMGGGADHTLSILELIDRIEALSGAELARDFGSWRVGDQKYYVSCTDRFSNLTGWRANTTVERGLSRLYEWLQTDLQPAPQLFSRPSSAGIVGATR